MGLLDQITSNPDAATALSLLGAGMAQGNMGAGLMNANQYLTEQPMRRLQQQELGQKIGLTNLQLQQAMQQWNMMQPVYARIAARLGGQGGAPAAGDTSAAPSTPAPSAPPAVMPGGPLGSGTAGIPIPLLPQSSQSAANGGTAPATAAPSSGASGSLFGVPEDTAMLALAGKGIPGLAEVAQQYNAPTDFIKSMRAAGIQEGSPEWNGQLRSFLTKQTYVAPTNIRGFGLVGPNGLIPLPMNAPQGSMPQIDPTSPTGWKFTQIPGGASAIQTGSQATATGKELGTLHQGVDASGNPVYTFGPPPGTIGAPTSAPTTPAAPGPVAPSVAAPAGQPAQTDRAAILQGELSKAQDRLQNPQKYMSPNDLMGDPQGALFRQRAQSDVTAIQNELSRLPGIAPAAPVAAAPASNAIRPDLSLTQKGLTAQGGDYYKAATTEAANVPMLQQMLDEINSLAADPKNTFGPGAPAVARVLALAKNAGIDMTGAQTAQDVIRKLASNIVMSQLGQGGQTGTDAQMNQIMHATPGGEMTNAAIMQVVPLLRQQLDVRQARINVVNNAVGQSQNFAQVPPVLTQFNRLASPPVVSLGMQMADAQRSGKLQPFIQGLTPAQKALLPQVRRLDQMGAF